MAAATLAKMVVGRRMRLGGEGGGEGGDGEGGEGGGAGQSETVPSTSEPQVGVIRQEQTCASASDSYITRLGREWETQVTVVTTMQGWHVNFFTPRGCWEILSVSTHRRSCVARDGAR